MERVNVAKIYNSKAFTIIEFVIVILILAILSISVIFSIQSSVEDIQLSALQNKLAQDLRYTQLLAMTRDEVIHFNVKAQAYYITDSNNKPIALANDTDTQYLLPLGVSMSWSTQELPNGYLSFDAKGIPYKGAKSLTNALANTFILTLKNKTESLTVTITPETGRIEP